MKTRTREMGGATPETMEGKEGREKFTKLKEAVGEYSEQKIAKISDTFLERFNSGKFRVSEPSGYTHPGVVYRNLIHEFTSMSCPENDGLNYTLFGLAIKDAMGKNPEFDEFIKNYIEAARKADEDAWNEREEAYASTEKMTGRKPEYLLDQNDDRYTQGKIMEKYILGEE